MATMTNRLQLLIDDDRLARLESESDRTGAPIAELLRRAIDEVYPAGPGREEALERLLTATPMPVEDWPTMKAALRDELSAVAPG